MISTISLDTLLVDGVECQNPRIISWEALNECTNITCKLENGDIKVEVSDEEDCEQACIRLIIACDDGCADCPPLVFETCLCDENGDCGLCENCIDGFCISKKCEDLCDPDTGDCVGCLIDADCTCDQLCVNNECQCPPGQVTNDRGCCVDCLTDAACPECEKCVGGACEPVVCSTGICDPIDDTCVECVITSDCVEDNQCCVANICVCCPGFILNSEGDCVPPPDCTVEEDCPDCFVCIDNECVPQTCPPGQTIDENCNCVTQCNCVMPDCPSGQSCVEGNIGLCYCIETPCIGFCDDSSDCGTGCGCQDGECVDCSTLTCNQCAVTDGCVCEDGVCGENPCSGDCYTGDDCGIGCGCLQGQCVPCDTVSCTTTPQCPNGCFCDGDTCAGNPCAEVFCTQASDCGVGCGCSDDGLCVPCTSLPCVADICADTPGCECNGTCVGDPDPDCVDALALTKIDGACDLLGTYDSASCCLCDDITATVNLTTPQGSSGAGYNDYDFIVTLRKDGVLLSGTGVANELPNSGTLRIRLRDSLIEANPDTLQPIPGGDTSIRELTVTANAAGLATIPMSIDNVEASSVVIGDTTYVITNRTVRFDTTANLVFPNECIYKLSTKNIYSWTAPFPFSAIPAVTYTLERLVNCRKPLFKFYRNAVEGNLFLTASNFLSVYADRVDSDTYQYLLTSYPNLQYGLYYGLTTDCGCDQEAVYSCYGTNDATPLVFCDPTEYVYEISECGKTLTFTENAVVTCDVYTAVGAPKPSYQLLINGALITTRTLGTAPSVGAILFNATTDTWTVDDCITSVEIKILLDECEDCAVEDTYECNDVQAFFEIEQACSAADLASVIMSATGGQPPYTYELFRNGVSISTGNLPPGVTAIPNSSGTYLLVVTDDNDCEDEVGVTYNANLNYGNNVTLTPQCTPTSQILVTNANSVAFGISIDSIGITTSVGANNSTTIPVTPGTYTLVFSDGDNEECDFTKDVTVNCCGVDNPANSVSIGYSCASGLILSPSPLPVGTTVFRISGVTEIPVVGGSSVPGGQVHTFRIKNGECIVDKTFFVPVCLVCEDSECIAATEVNEGLNIYPSGAVACGPSCQDCHTLSFTGDTTNSCEDLTVVITGGAGPFTTTWTGTGSEGTVIGQSGTVFNPDTLIAGETITLTVTVVSATCSADLEIPYSKCTCLCNNSNVCSDSFTETQGGSAGNNQIVGSFESGQEIAWAFAPFSVADQFRIKLNGVTILDTGRVTSRSSCTGSTVLNSACADLFLGDHVGDTGVALTLGTADVSPAAGGICPLDPLEVGAVTNTTLPNGLVSQMGGVITLASDGVVSIQVIGESCGAGGGTQWTFALACVE